MTPTTRQRPPDSTPGRGGGHGPGSAATLLAATWLHQAWLPDTMSDLTAHHLFCGAGGCTAGAVMAGVLPSIALNHSDIAVKNHQANFPTTDHVCAEVAAVSPRWYRRAPILIASPICDEWTNANGRYQDGDHPHIPGLEPDNAAEVSARRATMWDVIRWTEHFGYELVIVENVVQVPRKWVLWETWLQAFHALGYQTRVLYLNSLIAGVAQSRCRVYVVAWKQRNRAPDLEFRPRCFCPHCGQDVRGIQAHKPGTLLRGQRYREQYLYCCPRCHREAMPYARPAGSVINWDHRGIVIGERAARGKDPLVGKTITRIQYGLHTRVHEPGGIPPFIATVDGRADGTQPRSVLLPMPAQTCRAEKALVVPPGSRDLAFAPFISELYGTSMTGRPVTDPLGTITSKGEHHALITHPAMSTVPGMPEGLRAMVLPYFGKQKAPRPVAFPLNTLTCVDRDALVAFTASAAADGRVPTVEECEFRMLDPDTEIKLGMGFWLTYLLVGTRRERVALAGAAVTPPIMARIVRRCLLALGVDIPLADSWDELWA